MQGEGELGPEGERDGHSGRNKEGEGETHGVGSLLVLGQKGRKRVLGPSGQNRERERFLFLFFFSLNSFLSSNFQIHLKSI